MLTFDLSLVKILSFCFTYNMTLVVSKPNDNELVLDAYHYLEISELFREKRYFHYRKIQQGSVIQL